MALACVMMTTAVGTCTVAAADAGVPAWAYETIGELASDGYVNLPAGGLQGLTRQQMAGYTAKVLKELENRNYSDKTAHLSQSYAAVTRLSIQDDLQNKLLTRQLTQLQSDYQHALTAIKANAEKSARLSMRGSGDIVGIKMLQNEERANEAKLASTIGKIAAVKAKLAQYPIAQEQLQAKQNEVEQQLTIAANSPAVSSPNGDVQAAMKLRAEFAPELLDMGYFDDELAQRDAEMPPVVKKVLPPGTSDKRFKIDGEIRVDTRHNSNDLYQPVDLSRVRERLYMDYNIDDNWHLNGMLESEKAFEGDGKDGQLRLDRYYLTGHIGEAFVTAGAFGTMMAEGNIYDSKFKGVQIEAGDPVKYKVRAGSIDAADRVYTAEFSYDTPEYGLDGGIYRFEMNDSAKRTITMANLRKPLGAFDLGLMYLHGTDDAVGNGNGFVGTLSHGKIDTWKPGASLFYTKYYYQPKSTYVEHTMNGMADSMQGFKGWGLGYSYTLRKNLLATLEYDSLNDLTTGEHNNTIWAALSWYFNNYES